MDYFGQFPSFSTLLISTWQSPIQHKPSNIIQNVSFSDHCAMVFWRPNAMSIKLKHRPLHFTRFHSLSNGSSVGMWVIWQPSLLGGGLNGLDLWGAERRDKERDREGERENQSETHMLSDCTSQDRGYVFILSGRILEQTSSEVFTRNWSPALHPSSGQRE
jgi:hypothetical protein